MPGPVITLLSDFGLSDSYVGAMKGVISSICPGASLVDITHEVPPQDLLQGAFLLSTAWHFFPSGTVHVAVVDPGVGTERKPLLVRARDHFFLAPDNGILSLVLPDEDVGAVPFQAYQAAIPRGVEAFALTNSAYWRHPVSNTFHGRDIFVPAAANLLLGAAPGDMGERVEKMVRLAVPRPLWENGFLTGYVLHVDRFGNIVTNIVLQDIAEMSGGIEIEVGKSKISRFSDTYSEANELTALIGGQGYLEVALPNGNAALELGVRAQDRVVVRGLSPSLP